MLHAKGLVFCTVFFTTVTLLKNTVRLIENIEYRSQWFHKKRIRIKVQKRKENPGSRLLKQSSQSRLSLVEIG